MLERKQDQKETLRNLDKLCKKSKITKGPIKALADSSPETFSLKNIQDAENLCQKYQSKIGGIIDDLNDIYSFLLSLEDIKNPNKKEQDVRYIRSHINMLNRIIQSSTPEKTLDMQPFKTLLENSLQTDLSSPPSMDEWQTQKWKAQKSCGFYSDREQEKLKILNEMQENIDSLKNIAIQKQIEILVHNNSLTKKEKLEIFYNTCLKPFFQVVSLTLETKRNRFHNAMFNEFKVILENFLKNTTIGALNYFPQPSSDIITAEYIDTILRLENWCHPQKNRPQDFKNFLIDSASTSNRQHYASIAENLYQGLDQLWINYDQSKVNNNVIA